LIAHKASNYPLIYSKISQKLTGKDWFTNKNTSIVIDGFPRCANTYATFAFDLVQLERYQIAHHIHKKSQFLTAANYNIPAILLIRNPTDAVASLLLRQPKYDPEVLFKGYHYLYSGLINLNSYIVAEFNDVLNDYGLIIRKVNEKFGAHFVEYIKTEQNEKRVKEIIYTQDELNSAKNPLQRVAYPDQVRKTVSEKVKLMLQDKKYDYWKEKCQDTFSIITNNKALI